MECVVLRSWLMQVPADMAGTQPGMDYKHKNKTREKAVREKERQKECRLD